MNSFSLEQVINRHPLIVNPSTSLIETIGLMNRSSVASCNLDNDDSEFNSLIHPHTSCALVMADSQLLGIFTERDLVRLTAEGRTLAEMTVGEAMTQPVTTFEETEVRDVFAILSLTRQHGIRHLPIVDKHNQFLGIITPEELQRSLQPMDWLRFQRVVEVMSNTFIHALPTVSVLRVTQLMVNHQVSCVVIAEPFCNNENSELETSVENSPLRPVGIITERDIIQFQTLELNLGNIQAQTLMSTPLFLVSPEDSLWSVHQQMQQCRVRRLIVAGEQGELKGIITQNRLLQALDPKEMYGVIEVLQRQVVQLGAEKAKLLQNRAEELAEQVKKRTFELESANQQLQQNEAFLRQQIAREHLLAEITQSIHQTLDVNEVLQSAVEGLRQFLHTDRTIIFRFQPDWSGTVVAESVASGWNAILESEIADPCFEERYVEPYSQGRVSAIADFPASDVEPCHKELMAQFQVRANLVVPILQREHLWGLLIAHHCSAPRQWRTEEINLLQQLAIQLAIAIQQAELYQNNAEQAALIDIASDAIFVRDLSNRILFWSQGAERMYGWKAEEVRNQVAQELFHRESLAQLEVALNTTIERGNWNGELKQLTKEGKEIIVSSRWTLVRDQLGHPQSILVVNTDITEKKQLEQQLLHAQRLESIGTLAGRIAHDLNNILTPILGFTQLLPLKIPNLDESSLELLRIIRTNVLRGADIVKQVLLFSREIESEWELVNFALVLSEVLKLIRETFPKSIVIEDYISPNLWLVEGDGTQLHQVLMNLCVNAHDAMPDGGKLVISAENLCLDEQYSRTNLNIEVGNYILITVTDTGMGIPPEIIERIFEPFFTTKEPGRGTGLGLSTVIGIVKNHGGTIEVESDRSCGTQFKVYLPASESIAATETITSENIPSGQGELILVVDDEATIREITKATLETHNYRVITASDGLEAIAFYAQQPQEIRVVLMDLIMPEMDGLTAMRALKKINPSVKLIATSGLATKEKVTIAESIGIKAFLAKPYTAEKLLLNLNEAISAG